MKVKIIPIRIGGCTYYLAQYKRHWWQMWRYVKNTETKCPHLFKTQAQARQMAEIGEDFKPKEIFE